MENSYGIGVQNRYEILGEEDTDPCEAITQDDKKKKKKEQKKKTPGKENTDKKPETDVVSHTNRERNTDKAVKFSNATSREDRNNRRNREDTGPIDNFHRESAPRFDNERVRGRGRGGRVRGRGGRGRGFQADGFDSRGKREFDRMSGSDKSSVKSFEKRDGGGAHNWGKHGEIDTAMTDGSFDFDSSFGNNVESKQDFSGVENDPPKENEEIGTENHEEETTEPEGPTVEEPKEMTLDEWKAKQGERQKPTFNIRKAGEGEEGSTWKKGYVVHQKKAESDSDEEYDDDDEFVPRGRQKQIVNINIEFSEPRSLGGRGRARGRGGREGGRGRGNRAYNRGSVGRGARDDKSSKQSAPRVDDEKDFPSLE